MARSKKQIKAEITTPFMANETLAADYGFVIGSSFDAEFSLVSLENILFEIVALALFVHELFFDQHTKEVDDKLLNQKSGRLPWYKTMALNFQLGFNLVPDKDYYDNGTATLQQIEDSKIIKYAAVGESETESRIIIKIAGEVGGVLTDFTDPTVIDAIEAYFKEIKWPGLITIINYKADKLYLNIQIKRNAQLIDLNGLSIADANYPVNEAIAEFMKELPFNGELRLSALIDKLQLIPGVIDATILSAQSAWINPEINGYDAPQPIFISKVAISGYFEIVTFDNINYVV